jgi:hypothetical protein
MSNNSLSQEKLFGGRSELQMFPINMMEENNFGDSHDEDYADFGFTDDIDFIDARIDKSLAKERKKVLKEKMKTASIQQIAPKLEVMKNNSLPTPTYDEVEVDEVFQKEKRPAGRIKLFPRKIAEGNFFPMFQATGKYRLRKMERSQNCRKGKEKTKMRISQWRQVAAML